MNLVYFVLFDWLNEAKETKTITFLSRKSDEDMRLVIGSIRKTVNEGNYYWKVARITTEVKVSLE